MYSIEIGKLEGMLLERYGKWLNKEKNRNKEIEYHNSQIVNNYEIGNTKVSNVYFLDFIKEPKYKKVIGGCGICTSFWIGLILGIVFLGVNAFFVPFITVLIYQKL
jgi:formylglycine-generating enzyme required for sulfatase activity